MLKVFTQAFTIGAAVTEVLNSVQEGISIETEALSRVYITVDVNQANATCPAIPLPSVGIDILDLEEKLTAFHCRFLCDHMSDCLATSILPSVSEEGVECAFYAGLEPCGMGEQNEDYEKAVSVHEFSSFPYEDRRKFCPTHISNAYFEDLSLEECKQKCTKIEQCKSFMYDYRTGSCTMYPSPEVSDC